MAKPTRTFGADVGQYSTGTSGPDQIEYDLDQTFKMFDPNQTGGGIGLENLKDEAKKPVDPTSPDTVRDKHVANNDLKVLQDQITTNATNLGTHKSSTDHDAHTDTLYYRKENTYTKTELQTAGQAQVNWNNLTNVPALGHQAWKQPVATYFHLPTEGNAEGDLRLALDTDTVYTYDPAVGWMAIGASGSGISDHGTFVGLQDDDHPQYLLVDGSRAMTGDLDLQRFQLKNAVIQKEMVAPADPHEAQVYYNTDKQRMDLYTPNGWVGITGKGAVVRYKEMIATAGQTDYFIGDIGRYEMGTNAVTVYKDRQLVRKSEFNEVSDQMVSVTPAAVGGEVIEIYWFENSPEIVNLAVKADGSIQYNLNADQLDNRHASEFPLLGENNAGVNLFKSLNQPIDTRQISLTYNPDGKLGGVNELDGETVIKATTLNYDVNGRLATVDETVGGKTITTTLNFDAITGRLNSVTRSVI